MFEKVRSNSEDSGKGRKKQTATASAQFKVRMY